MMVMMIVLTVRSNNRGNNKDDDNDDVHYTRCSLYTISEVDNDYLDGEEYDMDNNSNTSNTNK